jgi:hypothetical protein
MSRRDSQVSPDYEVGFGRPPVATRFKKGQSGNPRGRPRGQRTIGQELELALSAMVTVTENGKARRLPMRQVIVRGIVNDAARRDPKALRLLFDLMRRQAGENEMLAPTETSESDDQAILADFLARYGAPPAVPETGAGAQAPPGSVEEADQ